MTAHLIEHGHTRISIHQRPPEPDRECATLRGLPVGHAGSRHHSRPRTCSTGLLHISLRARSHGKTARAQGPPTAIFASNDDMAAAAISVAHRRYLDVPRDLSVVGFDDTPTATTVWPELTTIRQPIAAMGESSLNCCCEASGARKGKPNCRRPRGCPPTDQTGFGGTASKGLNHPAYWLMASLMLAIATIWP